MGARQIGGSRVAPALREPPPMWPVTACCGTIRLSGVFPCPTREESLMDRRQWIASAAGGGAAVVSGLASSLLAADNRPETIAEIGRAHV